MSMSRESPFAISFLWSLYVMELILLLAKIKQIRINSVY